MVISHGNGSDDVKGSGFYKQSIIRKKFFGKDNTINCYVMYRNV